MTEDPLLTILVLTPSFVIVSLIFSLVARLRRLKGYRPILTVLIAPGIIMHEASHYMMCKLMRVKVEKVRLLEIDEFWNAGGYVTTEPIQSSFLKPFLIAIAPALINTSLACLLIFSYPYLVEQWTGILGAWLTISLILSCRPSLSDLATAVRSLVKYPKDSLREFEYLAAGLVGGLLLYEISPAIIGIELPLSLVAAFSMITIVLVYMLLRRV